MMRSDFAIDIADGATGARASTSGEIKVNKHIRLYSAVEGHKSHIYLAPVYGWDGVGYDFVALIWVHCEGEVSSFNSVIVVWDFDSDSEAFLYGTALRAEYQIILRIYMSIG